MRKRGVDSIMDDANAFRTQVRMAAVQVAGLRPEELETALAYEVEPFSGIPATEAELMFRPVADPDPAVRVYDVAVRRRRRETKRTLGDRLVIPLFLVSLSLLYFVWGDHGNLERRRYLYLASIAERQGWAADVEKRRGGKTALDKETAAINAEVGRINGETAKVNAEAAKQKAEAKKVRDARNAAIAAQNVAESQRAAFQGLLEAIPKAFGEQTVLKAIATGDPFYARISAASVNARVASEAMTALSNEAAARGWSCTPGAMVSSELGATVNFECELRH